MVAENFVTGATTSTCGPNWKRPRRMAWIDRRTRCVPIARTGTPSIQAHMSPGTMLATPGPAAPTTTVISPVLRAQPSAMCTPALS